MPSDKVRYYNKIDMGIFLFMLETCIEHKNFTYNRTLFADTTDDSIEQTLISKYSYFSKKANLSNCLFLQQNIVITKIWRRSP